jgi:hypothetical protein
VGIKWAKFFDNSKGGRDSLGTGKLQFCAALIRGRLQQNALNMK